MVRIAAGGLAAEFLPEDGMVCVSLRRDGREFLAEGGLPLMAPWANRLGARRYSACGRDVDLRWLPLGTDDSGLPIHGTMAATTWDVVDAEPSRVRARFDSGVHWDQLAAFPFPHALDVIAEIDRASLVVTTTLRPTGRIAVPVSFGWHPYFVVGNDWRVELPACRRVVLDERMLPTDSHESQPATSELLRDGAYDDHYELGDDRSLALRGPDGEVVVEFDDGYPYAQVFAPVGAGFACLEPMTARTNALVEGGFETVAPGEAFTATFAVRPRG